MKYFRFDFIWRNLFLLFCWCQIVSCQLGLPELINAIDSKTNQQPQQQEQDEKPELKVGGDYFSNINENDVRKISKFLDQLSSFRAVAKTNARQNLNEIVEINVGGDRVFTTLKSTLMKNVTSTLNDRPHLLKEMTEKLASNQRTLFIDREPKYFHLIVNYLRKAFTEEESLFYNHDLNDFINNQIMIDGDGQDDPRSLIRSEAEYFRLKDLIKIL